MFIEKKLTEFEKDKSEHIEFLRLQKQKIKKNIFIRLLIVDLNLFLIS